MLNECILQGRLTDHPELRTTDTGKSVTRFSLAVERDFSTGDEKETDFINIVAWNKTAEFIGRYFNKGQQMILRGNLQVRKYQTQNGENRYATEVIAEKVYFAGDKQQTTETPTAQGFTTAAPQDFEEITGDEELPF